MEKQMKKLLLLCCLAFFVIGFFAGRWATQEKKTVRYVQGETFRDTITNLVPDTVYLTGELRYKYVYKTVTICKDVPVIDRELTIAVTVEDWNRTREYRKLLFDNEFGKLDVALSVQYNELQKLVYSFAPMYKETAIVKKKVFEPFISVSFMDYNTVSIGGGFFYYNLGFRAEWTKRSLNFGVLYKF